MVLNATATVSDFTEWRVNIGACAAGAQRSLRSCDAVLGRALGSELLE